jgi:archaeal flagellar protein FlaI
MKLNTQMNWDFNPFKKKKLPEKDEVIVRPRDLSLEVVESYWIEEPLSKILIVALPGTKASYQYYVEEAPLNAKEKAAFKKILSILNKELSAPETVNSTETSNYVLREARRIALKYHRTIGEFSEDSWKRIFYYVVRDLSGYGALDAIMRDPDVEDISANGLKLPIFIWHRKFESMPTNIEIVDELALNSYILKLAHMSGKHISSAFPVLDAMLPEKHRLAATFMKEVSTYGSSFSIRKFRSEPFSIVDLVKNGTLNSEISAYLWLLLENKMNLMIIGGTGAGKTSMLNALNSLLMPNDKIITVEEVAELQPTRKNWVQLVSRRSFGIGASENTAVSLYDLVRLSLRYRPDYIIVGEIRGEEAYVLFQAIATGHGGMCTMHADNLDHAIKRITSPPMSVSEVYIPLMNVCLNVSRVDLPGNKGEVSFGRRVRDLWEIKDFGNYSQISEWDPATDTFKTNWSNSQLIERIAVLRGLKARQLHKEVDDRKALIDNMVKWNLNSKEVATAFIHYYEGKPILSPDGLRERPAEESSSMEPAISPAQKIGEPADTQKRHD